METKKPSNPIAFPQDADTCLDEFRGMTLRDYFAAKALQGFFNNIDLYKAISKAYNCSSDESTYSTIAKEAYKIADAMLKAREL
jgi:hypothetical protein